MHSPEYLFFSILIVAGVLIHVSNPVFAQGKERYSNCNAVFSCANRNLSYPFWGADRPAYCGHPDFELNCDGNVPVINISSISYRILEINEENRALTVARDDYWSSNCPSVKRNSTSESNLPTTFDYTSDGKSLTLFYWCPIPTTALLPNYFNCSGEPGVTNFFGTEDMISTVTDSSILTAIQGCEESVVVRISNSEASSLQSSMTNPMRQANLSVVLNAGFAMEWQEDSRCLECRNSGGLCGSADSGSAEFSCYCKDGSFPAGCGSSGSSSKRNRIIGITAGISAGIVILCIIMFICYCHRNGKLSKAMTFWKRDTRDEFDVEEFLTNYGSFAPKRYSYANVKKMTNSFAEKIGNGGFGSVYKGRLPEGTLVAVKMLKECKGNGEEFMNEVTSIGRTSHVNIVTLLGFCYERKKRALVYEYMPNGSLDKLIFNPESSNTTRCLEWKTLYEIATGVARGLEYLHRGCNTTILHFDIKPQNILLDEDLCPKISDFGLAKLWLRKENTLSMVGARGTVGFIAPEVFSRTYGRVSHKSDVYSYGMLVLEMVGGRKNFDSGASRTSKIYFPNRIYKDLEMGNLLNMLGNTTEEETELSMKMILVSFWCIQTNPSDRPSMSEVVNMLQGSLQSLDVPPKPYLFSPTRSTQQSSTRSL